MHEPMNHTLYDLLWELAPPEILEYPAGGIIFQDGNRATAIFSLKSGRARLVRFTPAGDMLTMYSAGPGDLLAEAALFGDHYHCQAQADIPSVIARHDKETLLRVLTADPRAMLRYAALLSRQLRDLRMRLELRSIRAAEDRVKQYLQLAADPANGRVEESGTIKDLAVRLGLAHETLYRVLASLERQGIIGRDALGIILNMGERP